MKIPAHRFRILAAGGAVAAMVLIQSLSSRSLGGSLAQPRGSTEVNLQSESRVLDRFLEDLIALDKKSSELRKKPEVKLAEFNALKSSGDSLKRRLADVQSAVRSVVAKLKAAGKFDTLDDDLLSKVSDRRFRSLARNEGGARRIFEDSPSQINSQADEILAPIDALRPRVQSRVEGPLERGEKAQLRPVPIAFHPRAPLFRVGLRCRLAWLRMGLGGFAGVSIQRASTAEACYCDNQTDACAELQQ